MNFMRDRKPGSLLSKLASKAEDGFSQIAGGLYCLADPASVEESAEEIKRDARGLLDRTKVFRRIVLIKN